MSKSIENPDTWVFLSHSNKDFERVTPIRNELERRQYRPLLFYLKCLENEQELEDLIKREIDARERFILCKSKNIKDSDWVKKEMDYIEETGRPYEVIDLDASKEDVDFRINLFDQRSTIYLFSTEDDVVGELEVLLAEKNFKVNKFKQSLPSDVSMITEGAYFIVLVSRDLKKNEVKQLKQFVKRFQMNTVAYRYYEGRTTSKGTVCQSYIREFKLDDHVDNNGYYDGWDDIIFRKKDIQKADISNIAETIVEYLMEWDKELYRERSKRKIINHDDNPPKLSRPNKRDFAERLNIFIESHKEDSPLKPIDKPSHKIWLGRRTKCKTSVQKDYLSRLNNKDLLNLINGHTRKKDPDYTTIYDCTDLEILLRAFKDLLGSGEEQAVNDEHGSISSALYYYIVHLLEENNIFIV